MLHTGPLCKIKPTLCSVICMNLTTGVMLRHNLNPVAMFSVSSGSIVPLQRGRKVRVVDGRGHLTYLWEFMFLSNRPAVNVNHNLPFVRWVLVKPLLISIYISGCLMITTDWVHGLFTFLFPMIRLKLRSNLCCCCLVRVQHTTQTALRFTLLNLLSEQQRTHDLLLFWWLKNQKWMGWMWIQKRLVNQGRSWWTQGRLKQQSPVPSHTHCSA